MLSRISRKIYQQQQQFSAAFLASSFRSSCFVPRAAFARNRMPLQPPPPPIAHSTQSNSTESTPTTTADSDTASQVDLVNPNSKNNVNSSTNGATSPATPSRKKFGSNPNKKLSKREHLDLLDRMQTMEDKELSSSELKNLLRADQHDQAMAMNIISEATMDQYDKMLDEQIDKRISNNESPHEIIKSLLSGSLLKDEQDPSEQLNELDEPSKQNAKSLKDLRRKKEIETSKKFGMFEMDPSLRKQADALNEFYSIMEQNKDKVEKLSLTELPLRDHLKMNRALTDQEKFQIESRASSVGAYVASPYSDPKNIPQDVLEPRVFEQGDPARMTKEQQIDFISKIKEKALDMQEDDRAEKVKKKTILAQKLHAIEVNSKDDSRFRSLVELDTKATELQVDAPTLKEKRALAREFADPKRDTFLVQQKRLEKAAVKLGIDLNDETAIEDTQVLAQISKESLFEQKKLAEENAEHVKRLERRNRLKELKKFEASLNYQQLNTDVDYSDPKQNFQGDNIPNHPLYSDLPDIQKLKALQEKYNSMVENDSHWDIHKKRSMKRVAEFIREKLASEKNNISSVTYFDEIAVDRYKNMLQRKRDQDEAEAMAQYSKTKESTQESRQKFLNRRLNSFAKELSGMMCREMGFKYGPDIRFAISKENLQETEMKKELAEVVPDIMQKQLIEKFQGGKIPQKINKAAFALETDQRLIDMEEKMKMKMESDQALIAQAKADEKADKPKTPKKTLRQNKDAQGKKLKKKRDKKSKQFWDSLDAY